MADGTREREPFPIVVLTEILARDASLRVVTATNDPLIANGEPTSRTTGATQTGRANP